MFDPHPDHVVVPPPDRSSRTDRRRFLLQVGILAGAALLPFTGRGHRRGRPERLETARPALGTWVRIAVSHTDEARAARAVTAAFAAIAVVDGQMSIHRRDSQIARVNAAAGREAVVVDRAVVDVVTQACAAARATGGAYDPTVLPLMRLYGFYGARRDRFPSDREIDRALSVTGHRLVQIDRSSNRVGLSRRGAAIDLGSIGKGWALDAAVGALRREGIESALVDVGGNVYALGTPDADAEGWRVAVAHPATGALARTFILRDEGIGTSGNAEQHHRLGQADVGHLLDARRGRPAHGPSSATVRAKTGTESDLYSTVAFLLGPDRFRGVAGGMDAHFIG